MQQVVVGERGDGFLLGELAANVGEIDLVEPQELSYRHVPRHLDLQLVALRRMGARNPSVMADVPSLEQAQDAVGEQLDEFKADQEHLVLRAPVAAPGEDPNKPIGTVMPPPWRDERPEVEGQLPSWSGTPLQPRNLGAPLAEGDVFCLVGDPTKMEAILYIDQGDVEFVAPEDPDQWVEIKLDELPFDTFETKITTIAGSESKVVSRRLSTTAGGDLPVVADPSGVPL